jgi:uncharacterized protein
LDAPGVLEIGAQSVLDTYLAHGLTEIDLLLPDANYDAQEVPQNLPALKALFSEWYTHHSHQGLRIRFFENTLRGLLGRVSKSEGLGLGVIALMGVTSDGGLEPLDVLRINGSEEVNTQLNLRTNTLQSITQNGLWQEVIKNSVSLPSACQNCPVVSICGGGYLPHRYKSGAGYNRPSIYCEQLKEFIYWVGESISKDINQKKEA